ncbi:hypothetical protein WJX81_005582 [Elliptochloris bilobata]|uniref:Peptidase A2 domain-containing protein n=1 Tax=Elliptochloris bilobata TaxID=381761 RepID=A0AAW1RGU3_9CHLO
MPDAEVVLSGRGRHLGTDVAWQLRCRPDGAFVEEVRGEHLSFSWGHPGGLASCWEEDDSGLVRSLELDDHESLLLALWVRTGFWLSPEVGGALAMRLLPPGSTDAPGPKPAPLLPAPAARGSAPGSAAASPAWIGLGSGGARGAARHTPGSAASSSGAAAEPEVSDVVLGLRLARGLMVARLRICTRTWLPKQLAQPLAGSVETWQFRQWRDWPTEPSRVRCPAEVRHIAAAGGDNTFVTESVALRALGPAAAPLAMPPALLRPADATFAGSKGLVDAHWTRSGHVVVQPLIDGRAIGYMIMDTGASGLVIEPKAADELGLSSFGELHVAGIAGRVPCRYRRAASLAVGPLTMARPLFMEMALGGLVRGAPGPVIGIIGYDLFRRAVVEIPPPRERHAEDAPEADVGGGGAREGGTQSALFMLDSGAGGVDVMFHERASLSFGLLEAAGVKTRFIRGVGGSEVSGVRVQSGNLSFMQLSGSRFERIRCLFSASDGLDLSLYTAGIICADLMARCTVIVDYARSRVAFIPTAPLPAPRPRL